MKQIISRILLFSFLGEAIINLKFILMSISEKEYIERNMLGFEGDYIMKEAIVNLVAKHGIDVIVETGTFRGGTTAQFAKMVSQVVTIEVNQSFYNIARKNLDGIHNVSMFLGDSPVIMSKVLSSPAYVNKKIFFFLDAHWFAACPLLKELEVIADLGFKPVIVIHDFYVPGKDFGYDSYNGQRFDFDFIKEKVERIYGNDGFEFSYNTEAEGAKRGVIYIEPK